MSDMGKHTTLVNGHRGEDGAIAAAPVIAPLDVSRLLSGPRGPVSDLPQPPQPDMTVPGPARFDGDRLRRVSMWLLASGVAAIAAVVSYSHIYDLGRAHGGSGVAARLLPLSVDMLILVGELMLLHEADGKGRRFALGWVLVWSGILATLAANVTYGAQYGVVGALIWGWPAYSFILAAGGMVAVVKRGANQDTDKPADLDQDMDKPVVKPQAKPVTQADRGGKDKPAPAKRTAPVSAMDKAITGIRENPGLSDAAVGRKVGVSAKTVQRARSRT